MEYLPVLMSTSLCPLVHGGCGPAIAPCTVSSQVGFVPQLLATVIGPLSKAMSMGTILLPTVAVLLNVYLNMSGLSATQPIQILLKVYSK
uniref:(California timema) hypothetical protein n=1 Tax=Timema californicum TaxID=61474 RepID=A0A7R9JMA2_TIMCA|nr:unnamed protein product [Timema californicum]